MFFRVLFAVGIVMSLYVHTPRAILSIAMSSWIPLADGSQVKISILDSSPELGIYFSFGLLQQKHYGLGRV